MVLIRILLAALATLWAGQALAFDFSFTWGAIPKCTSGRPGKVPNPVFKLRGVPSGTKTIRFRMKDLAVPAYPHGGGSARYQGKATIAPGAFTYRSPCPPGGRHTYEWTAEARDAAGKTLARATARRRYP